MKWLGKSQKLSPIEKVKKCTKCIHTSEETAVSLKIHTNMVLYLYFQDTYQDSLDRISELEKKLDKTQYESKAKDEMMEDMKETMM